MLARKNLVQHPKIVAKVNKVNFFLVCKRKKKSYFNFITKNLIKQYYDHHDIVQRTKRNEKRILNDHNGRQFKISIYIYV